MRDPDVPCVTRGGDVRVPVVKAASGDRFGATHGML